MIEEASLTFFGTIQIMYFAEQKYQTGNSFNFQDKRLCGIHGHSNVACASRNVFLPVCHDVHYDSY